MTIYNAAVAHYFYQDGSVYRGSYSGAAGSLVRGTWIGVRADFAGNQLTQLSFRMLACPHIIAACHWLAETLPGQPIGVLSKIDCQQLQQMFDIPVEKAGKLLILQDALTSLLEDMRAHDDLDVSDGN